jgi:ABC-2 type transport system ATP-binding protein
LIISIDKITVRFGNQKVLDDVNFQFSGGCLGLLGPNGAGKTTLLRILLGFIKAQQGSGMVLDCDIFQEQLKLRQKVGYMPENDCHIPGMTAVGFVAYAGQLAGMSTKDSMQRAHEILYYVGLGDARYRKVETYSQGMKQRIKLAQALVHDPTLIFLDEPTNGLDPKGRMEMLDLIRDISQSKGLHVLLSSHLLPDVEKVCGDAVVIDKGRILASGKIKDLKSATDRMYECRIKGAEKNYIQALVTAGCHVIETDEGNYIIQTPQAEGSRLLLELAHSCRTQIRHLMPLKQSLEDVFIKVIGESNANL